jgi:hypothetical protein
MIFFLCRLSGECGGSVARDAVRHIGALCRRDDGQALCTALLGSDVGVVLLSDPYVYELRVAQAPLSAGILQYFCSSLPLIFKCDLSCALPFLFFF